MFNQRGAEERPPVHAGKDYLLRSYYVLSEGMTAGKAGLCSHRVDTYLEYGHPRNTVG